MAYKFNPFTDTLDIVGSGGGTSYIDGDVEYHSNLPVTVGTPAVNSAFLVRKGEGLYFISRKPAGIWVRELNNGNLDDWKYAGTFSDLYRDANFRIINDTDVSKELAFDLSGITTGTTRTITVPDANVTLPNQGTSTSDSPTFAQVTINDTVNEQSTLTLSDETNPNKIEFATQELTLRHTGTNDTPYINVTDGTDYALLGVRQGDMFLQGSNAVVRIEKGGGALADIKVNKLILEDATTAGDFTATFDPDANLSANRTYDLPNASGTLALTSDFAAPPAIGNTTPAAITGTTGTFTTLTANTSLTLNGTGAAELINAGAAAGPLRIYNTFTSATNHERGFLKWNSNVLQIGTEAGSGGGTARAFELVHGGTAVLRSINGSAVSIPNGGQLVFGNSSSVFYWNGGPVFRQEGNYIFALRDGNNANTVRIYNTWASATSFERLNIIAQSGGDVLFGTEKGTTGGSARGLQLQTDNTTRLTIGSTGGFTLADAQDIAVGTTTGTKIGTATTQKIGFFNATPVVQQAAVADATDAASTQDRLNDLLARLRTLGLIAT
jgi:hypothetical protein